MGRDGSGVFSALIESLSISLAEIVIWFIAVRGAIRFRQYTDSIKGTKDGVALGNLSTGLNWLVVYIVILIIAGPTVHYFKHSSLINPIVIVSNHIPLIFALLAVGYGYVGSMKLNQLVPFKISNTVVRGLSFFVLILGLFYTWYFRHFVPTLTPDNGIPRFAAPAGVLIFSYVLPYIITWALGIFTIVSVGNYAMRVKGAIYKQLFQRLGIGVIIVLTCIFLAQLLVLTSLSLSKFNLLILFTYGLLLLGAYGFLKIYQGADDLHKIESV
jgi:hypothetical protein